MEAEAASTSLPSRTRQVIILAVGAVWQADYELYAHSAEAGAASLSEPVIGALVCGGVPDALSETQQVAARGARQLTRYRRIDATNYAMARRLFGDRGMVDLVLLVGYYQTVCGVRNALEIPSPDAAKGTDAESAKP